MEIKRFSQKIYQFLFGKYLMKVKRINIITKAIWNEIMLTGNMIITKNLSNISFIVISSLSKHVKQTNFQKKKNIKLKKKHFKIYYKFSVLRKLS